MLYILSEKLNENKEAQELFNFIIDIAISSNSRIVMCDNRYYNAHEGKNLSCDEFLQAIKIIFKLEFFNKEFPQKRYHMCEGITEYCSTNDGSGVIFTHSFFELITDATQQLFRGEEWIVFDGYFPYQNRKKFNEMS